MLYVVVDDDANKSNYVDSLMYKQRKKTLSKLAIECNSSVEIAQEEKEEFKMHVQLSMMFC